MPPKGFTLIELLVALAVFALMAAMAYGGLAAMLDAKAGIDQALDRGAQVRSAMFRLQSDLAQAVNRPIRDGFGDVRPAMLGSPDFGIEFTTGGWRNPLALPRSSLQRVAYRVDEENRLLRLHWRVLDRAQDGAPVESVLLEEVEALEWRYLTSAREWVGSWPPANASGSAPIGYGANAGLPLAVELQIETGAWGDLRLLVAIAGGQG